MTGSESAAGRKRKATRGDDAWPSSGRLEDLLLNTAQVAQMLHITSKAVIALVQAGRLKAHRVPGTRQYLFWRQEIIDLIDASVVKPEDMGHESERGVTAEQ